MGIIGIITDFGARGMHYVAEMKGVMLSINPQIRFLDITHEISPFAILEAAYVLHTTIPLLPSDSIIICVVDPGVGSDRAIVALQLKSGQILIGPDNGIFSYFVLKKQIQSIVMITASEFFFTPPNLTGTPIDGEVSDPSPSEIKLSMADEDIIKMVAPDTEIQKKLIPPEKPVSSTFHGRDIMSPIAAHLSLGLDLFALGDPLIEDDLEILPVLEPDYNEEEQILEGIIQYIDAFGNCITNIEIRAFDVLTGGMRATYSIKWKGEKRPIQRATIFAGNDPEFLLLVDGSSGFLEICMNRGNAAREMKAIVGTKFEIQLTGLDIPFLNGLKRSE
jgi:S-adenosylmethionine hydrolase